MAGNILTKYGPANQAITCSLAPGGTGLASGSARAGTAIDNSANDFQDVLVSVAVKTGTGTIAGQKSYNVYVFATTDGGTTYTEGATGTDAALTLVVPTNLILLGTISTPAQTTTYRGGPWSVASEFGNTMPDHWGIVIENQSGVAADGTEANHTKTYQGVYGQYT